MRALLLLTLGVVCLGAVGCATSNPPAQTPATQPAATALHWEKWSDDLFARAARENRFVILDLEAVWCHWCHVMDEKTYHNPAVIKLLNDHYICVRVDQDSRPDISNKYEDYGWPATIVFNSKGGEIVKRRGYLPPEQMASMLQAIIDDPTPGPSVQAEEKLDYAEAGTLPAQARDDMKTRLDGAYDDKYGAWGRIQKLMDWDAVQYCMLRAKSGDARAKEMATKTLLAQRKLIDPVWGGVSQYSTDGDWDHVHFEKIMQFQAENLRTYALAYAMWHDDEYLKAATQIHGYLIKFLKSPDGAFYVSQDADLVPGEHSGEYYALDDAGRRKLGVPRIDTHIYSRENGWVIQALIATYAATADPTYLKEAQAAANWIVANRALDNGGFRHDQSDAGGPYLADTLQMGRALLDLYKVTADPAWLKRAESAATFIATQFKSPGNNPGLLTSPARPNQLPVPTAQVDENIAAARFLNLLGNYTGVIADHAIAEQSMRFLATPQVIKSRGFSVAGILLADNELTHAPPHITIVGPKSNTLAKELFQEALRFSAGYTRLEWLDPTGPALPNPDVEYPPLKDPAAFVCKNNTCSSPMASVEALRKALAPRGN